MKKFFVLLIFFSFLGCEVSPFVKETEKVAPWKQNKIAVCYDQDIKTVFLKAKKVLDENEEPIKYECIEGSEATIETNKLKISIYVKSENTTELTIKTNSPRSTEHAKKVIESLTIKINSVEYDKEGKPIN